MDEGVTKPTIETVLERIEALRLETREQIEGLRLDTREPIEALRAAMIEQFRSSAAEGAANHRALQRQFDHLAGELGRIRIVQDYIEEQLKKPV